MKRIVSILCCILLMFSLTACGGKDNKQQLVGTQSTIDTKEEENSKEPEISVPTASGDEKAAEQISDETNLQHESENRLQTTDHSEKTVTEAADMPIQESLAEKLNETEEEKNAVKKMNIQIGDTVFTATMEGNSAVTEFIQMMREAPVVVHMSDYSGFEKVGSLGTSLTAVDSQTTTQSGDIVLYNGNQIVIFYGSNSWSYTRLGRIDDLSGWAEALGSGDVQVTFSVVE